MIAAYLLTEYSERYNYVSDSKAATALLFESNSSDIVSPIGALEHVRETCRNDVEFLTEIKRILKPGGFFICHHWPNKYSWIESMVKHLSSKFNHKYIFSRKDIRVMFDDACFSAETHKRYGLFHRLMFRNLPGNNITTTMFSCCNVFFSKIFIFFVQTILLLPGKLPLSQKLFRLSQIVCRKQNHEVKNISVF